MSPLYTRSPPTPEMVAIHAPVLSSTHRGHCMARHLLAARMERAPCSNWRLRPSPAARGPRPYCTASAPSTASAVAMDRPFDRAAHDLDLGVVGRGEIDHLRDQQRTVLHQAEHGVSVVVGFSGSSIADQPPAAQSTTPPGKSHCRGGPIRPCSADGAAPL